MLSIPNSDNPDATSDDVHPSMSHKTVFVLDRSKYFTHVSSGHLIKGDSDSKNGAYEGQSPIQPFDRSLWTCAVEAVVGYSRLIWDVFMPQDRCISILAATSNEHCRPADLPIEPQFFERICSWSDKEQNLDYLLRSLAYKSYQYQVRKLDRIEDISKYPNANAQSPSILRAIEEAVSDLSLLTQGQIDRRSTKRHSTTPCVNNGRIILISSFQDQQSISDFANQFETILKRKNESLALDSCPKPGSKTSPINHCDLVIVNTFPIQDTGCCSKINSFTKNLRQVDVQVYSVKSGKFISGLINNLCLEHHNLTSTTITGIPMKEEQNASKSAQYDVEIIHSSRIHQNLSKLDQSLLNGALSEIDRNGFTCATFKLHWCSPRTPAPDMHHCLATSRITLVDVYSRPSACLTNFLMSGRQVLLEIYKSRSNRATTHVLASRNGELYIHSLATSQQKSSLGDPPSISENLGGKVGDYRVHDFVSLMKKHMLVPNANHDDPLTKTMTLIRRHTLYWPISIGHTILMNIPNLLGELVERTLKETITLADVDECRKCINNLMKSEKDGMGLPSITLIDTMKATSSKASNSKLDNLYRLLWNELEYFLRVHSTSPEHELILEHLLERNSTKTQAPERGTKRAAQSKVVESSPMKKLKVRNRLIPDITEPGSAESFERTRMFYGSGLTLYQTWSTLYTMHHRSRSKLPFVGRSQPTQMVQHGAIQQVPMET